MRVLTSITSIKSTMDRVAIAASYLASLEVHMQLTMTPASNIRTEKSRLSSGESLHCIHCFRNIGKEPPRTSRSKLISKHHCTEQELAKKPGAPAPFN